ncbi:MAG TPA: DNA-processing protein DprA [Acidimicrobiia bacterium]|nr:DNA-processing protein DprA [Acidimicrobiia bacterium]
MSEVRLVRPGEHDYPDGLNDLEQPPPLYVLGTTTRAPAVAVVGTRRSTRYGMALALGFGEALSRAGWTTVSGLARGIDGAAHLGALRGDGTAVAVLGSGVDVVYPEENIDLYRSILDGHGAIVSEYPPGTRPDRWRFPARNRIIAAIASAVVVVEAGEKGGALITARMAAEMGRPVLVVPGDVDRLASVGCNRLIRDGAHPVLGVADLIAELELILGRPPVELTLRAEEIPITGIAIDDLPEFWRCSPAEALARLARMEVAGRAMRSGERVLPAG